MTYLYSLQMQCENDCISRHYCPRMRHQHTALDTQPLTVAAAPKQPRHLRASAKAFLLPLTDHTGVPPKLIIFNGFLVGAGAQHCQGRYVSAIGLQQQ